MIVPLVMLFLLGALQGAIGWIMVKSGLNDNDVYVSHIRLAAAFYGGNGINRLCLNFWIKANITPAQISYQFSPLLHGAIIITCAYMYTIGFGAFMAGLKAAAAAPTWPDINGEVIPEIFAKPGFCITLFTVK